MYWCLLKLVPQFVPNYYLLGFIDAYILSLFFLISVLSKMRNLTILT